MKYYYLYIVEEFAEAKPNVMHIGSFENEQAFEDAKKSLITTLKRSDRKWWAETCVVKGLLHCYVTMRNRFSK